MVRDAGVHSVVDNGDSGDGCDGAMPNPDALSTVLQLSGGISQTAGESRAQTHIYLEINERSKIY